MPSEEQVEEVRAALNNISEEELSTDTIEIKIKDAEYYADNKGLEGYEREKFIRAYAALKSFIVSNTYSRVDFGDVSVAREWQEILRNLEEELKEVASIPLVVDDSHMFDERPSDRINTSRGELENK